MARATAATNRNVRLAKQRWGSLPRTALMALRELSRYYRLSVVLGDLFCLDERWYISHAGLLRIAERRKCSGIGVECIVEFSDPAATRWAFKATVFKSRRTARDLSATAMPIRPMSPPWSTAPRCGLPKPGRSTVPCARPTASASARSRRLGSLARASTGCSGVEESSRHSRANGNCGGPNVRDRLCQLIRQHQLDADLVKAYAIDFCGVKTLREATREQVENFVQHLADWAEKDRNALLCQLNSYLRTKEGAA